MKISYVEKESQSNHPSQEMKIKKKKSKKLAKIKWCERSINYKLSAYFFYRSMQGRENYRLDPATSIQEQKYSAYCTLPCFEKRYPGSFCWLSKASFQFRFLKRWLVCSTFFLYVGSFKAYGNQSKISKNRILKYFGLVAYLSFHLQNYDYATL